MLGSADVSVTSAKVTQRPTKRGSKGPKGGATELDPLQESVQSLCEPPGRSGKELQLKRSFEVQGVVPFYCGRPTTTLYLPKQNGNGHTDVDHQEDRSGNGP